MAAHKDFNRAKTLYVDEGWTAKQISKHIEVSEQTLSSWVKKYNWKEQRLIKNTTPETFVKKYDTLLNNMLDKRIELEEKGAMTAIETAEYKRLIDDMSKLSALKEKVIKEGKISLGTHVRCVERFMTALNKEKPKLFNELLEFNRQYFMQLHDDLK